MKNRSSFNLTGILMILAGIIILIGSFIPDFTISKLWPLFLLIPVFIFAQLLIENGRESYGVLVPGGILLYLTVYFLWLSFTSWGNVASTWPNFLLAPAFGLFCFYLAIRTASLLIPIFILTFTALLFFGGIFKSYYIIALVFIAGGIFMFLTPIFRGKRE